MAAAHRRRSRQPATLQTLSQIHEAGFGGFESVAALRANRLAAVPGQPGVYLVLRTPSRPPQFLTASPAGMHKGRDPTLPLAELQSRWATNALILYIGKAGGVAQRGTLRSRLSAYLRSGAGQAAGHWGGRVIWQLADSDELVIAWRCTEAGDARALERLLLESFVRTYGRRPFANRTG